ncbi:hypothetical protein LTS07_006358 [Exophiala sideris]|uniref:Uncharacterized protein n=1 Tax=Exophiala sideris TaxID=1016849 RepID=A0ABR0J5P5_9EURO|nr:hypothetical protein LTS07_006358 [Exophiala sideris]KAK5036090.1 hypothetical protein LTR13_005660 [Exophiala sideris]KAK5057127.1 hypothetical protein LTR69_007765 [Exophiala sideris]KAK5181534.1 hypothetical protein LTR44_006329 [Eurotiomycetes sp. CCFEE 6388]
MKSQYNYSASDYVRDNGYILTWMCKCCCATRATSGMDEEFQEYQQRTKVQPGTVIGRPAGREAYLGRSATMHYVQQQARDNPVENAQKDDKSAVEATSET